MSVPNAKPEGKPNELQETGDDLGLSPSADWGLRALLMVLLVWLGWSQRAGDKGEVADFIDPANDGINAADDGIDAPPPTRSVATATAPLVVPLARKNRPAPKSDRPPPVPVSEPVSFATPRDPARTVIRTKPAMDPAMDPATEPAMDPAMEHKRSRRPAVTTAGLTPNQQWLATATAIGAVVAYRAGRRTQRPH